MFTHDILVCEIGYKSLHDEPLTWSYYTKHLQVFHPKKETNYIDHVVWENLMGSPKSVNFCNMVFSCWVTAVFIFF